MSPASGLVLGSAAIVASPALWSSVVEGTMPLDVGLTRYLIVVGVCWALLSVVSELIFSQSGPQLAEADKPDTADSSADSSADV